MKKLGASLEKKSDWKLANSTTDYEIEIRLIEAKDGSFVPFLKLYSMKMKRFAYRKNAIAMSIHPATAAMLMYLAKPYLKEKCTDFRSVLRCWNNADRARYLSSGKGKIWD